MEQTGKPVPGSTAQMTEGASPIEPPSLTPFLQAMILHAPNDRIRYITNDVSYRRIGPSAVQLKSSRIEQKLELFIYSPSKFIEGQSYKLVATPPKAN